MSTSPAKRAVFFTGAIATAAILSLSGAVAAQAADPLVVSIRAELDLPTIGSGPAVFEVTDVVAGDQVELTGADLIENPSGWYGTISVDVDPTTKDITVFSDEPGDFYTVKVVVTSDQIGDVTLVSDTLLGPAEEGPGEEFEGEGEGGELPVDGPSGVDSEVVDNAAGAEALDTPVAYEAPVLTYGTVGGAFVADWVVPATGDSLYPTGTAVFSFGAAAVVPAPEIAATGLDAQTSLIVGGSVLALGAVFLLARRRTA